MRLTCHDSASISALLMSSLVHEDWTTFVRNTLAPLIAVQNQPQVIVDTRTAELQAAAGALHNTPNSNFIFGDRSGNGGGFFDDDDDDDDDDVRGVQYSGGQSPFDASADFAQFDAFSATMAPLQPADDSIFSFAAFDNPDLFSSDPVIASTSTVTPDPNVTGKKARYLRIVTII
jgi:hypothetical protein